MPYDFHRKFKKSLSKKPHPMQDAIMRTVLKLDQDPKRPGLEVHQVEGSPGVWEAYVDQKNRLTFERDGNDLYFLTHCNHDILKRA